MKSQQPELETLIKVLSALGKAGIPYMLTGSLAKTFYATPRMTRDIDIVIALDENSADQIVDALQD